jgi:four helix bundle protein
MNYGSTKAKGQSSREGPEGKEQWRDDAVNGERWWLAEEPASLVLNDKPTDGRAPHQWDLLERTAVFGERVIRFLKQVPSSPRNDRLIDQLVGAATSVGANYCEANESVSRKDFKFTITRCVKEAKESKFFLRMIAASEPQLAEVARPLYREAHELLCIFASMRHKP